MRSKPHESFLRSLSRELDGELGESEREELYDHLKACSACRRVAGDLRKMSGVMRDESDIVPSRDLTAEVLAGVGSRRSAGPTEAGILSLSDASRTLNMVRRMAAVAAALVLVGSFLAFRGPSSKLFALEPGERAVESLLEEGPDSALQDLLTEVLPPSEDPNLHGDGLDGDPEANEDSKKRNEHVEDGSSGK